MNTNYDPQSEGALLLDEVEEFCSRFIAYPSEHAAIAHVLWCAHAHGMRAWESTPRIAFLSPEPGSGKTRALEVTELLTPRPVEAINVSAAYLFRKISDRAGQPTILYDEIDTVFGPKAKENEEIRAVLNSGHRRGAVAGRCVVRGKNVELEELPAYAAVAVAGLGNLPDTILSRSVVVLMRRRAPTETIQPFRRRIELEEGHDLRERLALWMDGILSKLADARPAMPQGIEDRNADVWEALLAIADAAGEHWPERARVAAVTLVALAMGNQGSLGIRLLTDCKTVFGDLPHLSTRELIERLCGVDESPWNDIKGSAITDRRLAHYLKPYGVKPKPVRIGELVARGYTAEDFFDAWSRYLSPTTVTISTNVTSDTSLQNGGLPLSPKGTVTSVTSATQGSDEMNFGGPIPF